jgi:hypothetical protein
MNFACTAFKRIFTGSRPYVPVLVPITLDMTVKTGDHNVMTDIELTPLVKQRMFDIALNYECLGTSIWIFLFSFDDVLNFLQS